MRAAAIPLLSILPILLMAPVATAQGGTITYRFENEGETMLVSDEGRGKHPIVAEITAAGLRCPFGATIRVESVFHDSFPKWSGASLSRAQTVPVPESPTPTTLSKRLEFEMNIGWDLESAPAAADLNYTVALNVRVLPNNQVPPCQPEPTLIAGSPSKHVVHACIGTPGGTECQPPSMNAAGSPGTSLGIPGFEAVLILPALAVLILRRRAY